MTELAGEVSFPPSSFSRLVDAMEAENLVKRTADPTNRRANLLCLTDEGRHRVAEAIAAHEPIAQSRFADHLTDHEINVLETVTGRLRDANSGDLSKMPAGAP